ncbi:hypothetical protein Tco_1466584 [Tanacetum coccineum]
MELNLLKWDPIRGILQLGQQVVSELVALRNFARRDGFEMANSYVDYEGLKVFEEYRAPRNQDYKNKESTRRNVPVETSTSTNLVSCDGLGGYDYSDTAKEGPNYALMAYSSSSSDLEESNNSNYSKSCLKTVETLKSHMINYIKILRNLS